MGLGETVASTFSSHNRLTNLSWPLTRSNSLSEIQSRRPSWRGKNGHEGKQQRESPGQRKPFSPHYEACKSPRILHDHTLRRQEARSICLRNLLVLDVQKILLREPCSTKALIQPLPEKPDDQDQPPFSNNLHFLRVHMAIEWKDGCY